MPIHVSRGFRVASRALAHGARITSALVLLACGSAKSLGDAKSAYEESRFSDAAEALCGLQLAQGGGTPQWHLYMGLTLLALGDATGAAPHLEYCRRTLLLEPAHYSDPERAQLQSALGGLNRLLGQGIGATTTPATRCLASGARGFVVPYQADR